MSLSRNQIKLLDLRPTIDSIIKKVRSKTFTPATILARVLNETFPRLRKDAFDMFAIQGLSGSVDEKIARELLAVLNKKSRDPNFSPMQAAIVCLNANSEKLKSARKISIAITAFFSVYEHYRHFLSPSVQTSIPYFDAWQQDLTRQVDLVVHRFKEQRGKERADTITSIVTISLNTPRDSKILDEAIDGIIFHLEIPSVDVYNAIHRLKSRLPIERMPYVINKLWDARKQESSAVVTAGLEVLAGFIDQASPEKIVEIVAGLRNIVGIHDSAEIRLAGMRCLMHCLKHLMLGEILEIIELLLQRMTRDESMDVRLEASECIVTFVELIEGNSLIPHLQILLQLMSSNEVNKARQVPEILCNIFKIANEEDCNQIVRALIAVANNDQSDALVRQAALHTLMHLGDRASQVFHTEIMQCYLRCMDDNNGLVSKAACCAINLRHDWFRKHRITVPVNAMITGCICAADEQVRLEIIKKLSLLTKVVSLDDIRNVITLIIEKIISAEGAVQEDNKIIYCHALKNIFIDLPQEEYHLCMGRIFYIISNDDYSEKCRVGLAYFAMQCFGDREYDRSCCDVGDFMRLITNKSTPAKLVPVMLEIISLVKGFAESKAEKVEGNALRAFALESILSPDEQLRYYGYLLLTEKFNRFTTDDCLVINNYLSEIPNLTLAKKAELLVKFKGQIFRDNFDRFMNSILTSFSDNSWLDMGINERADTYQALHICVPHMSQNQKVVLLCQLIHLLANDQLQLELKPLFLHAYFGYKQDLAAMLLQKKSISLGQDFPDEMIQSVMTYTT